MPYDPYDPGQQQQGEDIKKPYASILIAVFAIVGGIALIYLAFGAFTNMTSDITSSGIRVQHVLQDQRGYAGYQPAAEQSPRAAQQCMETNSCDECLALLSGRACDCDKECASLKCVESQCV